MAITPKAQSVHYVNNAEFSKAVVEYCTACKLAKANGETPPKVTNYIASCFLKICEGLSHKDNFIRYTYREEMVMDAVENCLRAIENFNVDVATRTGKVNAFAYFTQIAWFAFIRRITKEKRQQDIKIKYLMTSGMAELIAESGDQAATQAIQSFVDQLRDRIDKVKERDTDVKMYVKKEKARRKASPDIDSDLQDFMEE